MNAPNASDALQLRGPVLAVEAMPLNVEGGDPASGLALIDTGAAGTCIDDEVAASIGCPVVGTAQMASATHDAVEVPVYAVQLNVPSLSLIVTARRAFAAQLRPQGLVALIGRDILKFWNFTYNGPAGTFGISIPTAPAESQSG